MKIKRTLVSVIAALGLAASVMAPVAMAQPSENGSGSNTTTAEVTVSDTGTFDVYFESTTLDLTDVTLSALNPTGTATGAFRIAYIDTLSSRPSFDVKVFAPNFSDGTNTIPTAGFEVTHTYNIRQYQWDSGNASGGTIPLCGCDVGDIGYFKDGAYVDQNSSTGDPDGHDWTPGATNLAQNPTVQFGYAGAGTHSSYGDVDVALDVPSGTVPGTYTSNLILTVVAGTQP